MSPEDDLWILSFQTSKHENGKLQTSSKGNLLPCLQHPTNSVLNVNHMRRLNDSISRFCYNRNTSSSGTLSFHEGKHQKKVMEMDKETEYFIKSCKKGCSIQVPPMYQPIPLGCNKTILLVSYFHP